MCACSLALPSTLTHENCVSPSSIILKKDMWDVFQATKMFVQILLFGISGHRAVPMGWSPTDTDVSMILGIRAL